MKKKASFVGRSRIIALNINRKVHEITQRLKLQQALHELNALAKMYWLGALTPEEYVRKVYEVGYGLGLKGEEIEMIHDKIGSKEPFVAKLKEAVTIKARAKTRRKK